MQRKYSSFKNHFTFNFLLHHFKNCEFFEFNTSFISLPVLSLNAVYYFNHVNLPLSVKRCSVAAGEQKCFLFFLLQCTGLHIVRGPATARGLVQADRYSQNPLFSEINAM